jgi:serine acetyltransferase
LAPGAKVSPDIRFGHHGFGTMIHSNVVIGKRVKIWHNVTIAVRAQSGWDMPHGIVIEDDVGIGANAVIMSPHHGSLTIGKGARIGAGTVVTRDVPPGATVVGARPRILPGGSRAAAGEELAAMSLDALADLQDGEIEGADEEGGSEVPELRD